MRALAQATFTTLLLLACTDGTTAAGGTGGAQSDLDATTKLDGARPPIAAPDGCRPPAGATALCLTFKPEAVAAESEPGLDERGYFNVEVFDTPSPPGGSGAAPLAIYDRTIPSDADAGGEIALADLPAPSIVFDNPPPTVFVRALFFDNGGFTSSGGFSWGAWLGGLDLSRGLAEDATLLPVPLRAGETTSLDVPLLAYRRLSVTVTTSVTPLGDGEGSLSVAASRIDALPPTAETYGYGIAPCVDVTKGPQKVDMVLLGSGKFFIAGFFDDLGIQTPGKMPPGTLLSLHDYDPVTGKGTFDEVTLTSDQYSATMEIVLGFVSELPGSPSAVGPNSCRDLGLTTAP